MVPEALPVLAACGWLAGGRLVWPVLGVYSPLGLLVGQHAGNFMTYERCILF